MDWLIILFVFFGLLIIFMLSSMPISFAFIITSSIGAYFFWGGMIGLDQLTMSLYSSVTSFVLLPIPLFILMGNIIHASNIGSDIVDSVDMVLGRLPGRLSLLAIACGTLLGTMIGISAGTIGILGKGLIPEMRKRGYKDAMTFGPIVSSGTLATLIPPSALGVFLGAIARVSISQFLIAIIIPGLIMAVLFCLYIITRCILQPSLAPHYQVPQISFLEKVIVAMRFVLPVLFILLACIGVIFAGIATPSEAAALGAMACFILAAFYRRFSVKMVRQALLGTSAMTIMIFMVMVGSVSFSRILVSSGAISGLVGVATSLDVPPITIVIFTQFVILLLGCFMEPGSIIMITMPMFIPIINALQLNTVWFAVLSIINIQLGLITPPLGLDCYIMKSIVPDVRITEIFASTIPFLIIGFMVMALIMCFPQVSLWLPSLISN